MNALTKKTFELCRLITVRNVNDDIGEDIKALVKQVDINFCDEEGNTALHVAARKKDLKCLEFLNQLNADRNIINDDGDTPDALLLKMIYGPPATETNSEPALSQYHSIEERFIREFSYENLKDGLSENLKFDPTFKVLKITNVPKISDFVQSLNNSCFSSIIDETSHLFMIVIISDDIDEDFNLHSFDALSLIFKPVRRPFIVEIGSFNKIHTFIYYKELNESALHHVENLMNITSEGLIKKMKTSIDCNIVALIQALKSKLLGEYSGSLVNAKLVKCKSNQLRNEITSLAAKHNVLCFLFLKLFEDELDDSIQLTMVELLKEDKTENIFALINFPLKMYDDETNFHLSTKDRKLVLKTKDERGYNLLMIAVDRNNIDVVKAFLKCDFNLDELSPGNGRAVDIAWANKHFVVLLQLLAADSPFPEKFEIKKTSSTELSKEISSTKLSKKIIKEIISDKSKFHEALKHDSNASRDQIFEYLNKHPEHKFCYDVSNKTALTTALEAKQIKLFTLLISQGLTSGIDAELYYKALELNEGKNNEIAEENKKYFVKHYDGVLLYILSKCQLRKTPDRISCFVIIRKMLEYLKSIPEVEMLMMVAASSDDLEIVFDFSNRNVKDLFPRASVGTDGLSAIDGYIYIAASDHEDSFYSIAGVLAHELTHFVMLILYQNSYKPYRSDDTERRGQYAKILKKIYEIYEKEKGIDTIISNVFIYYPMTMWKDELIVRVPQLLAHYKNEPKTLDAIRGTYCADLFLYYADYVNEDLKSDCLILRPKALITEINNLCEIVEKLHRSKLKLSSQKLKKHELMFDDLKSVKTITTNVPQFALKMIQQMSQNSESFFVFLTAELFMNKEIVKKCRKLFRFNFKPYFVIDCPSEISLVYQKLFCEFANSIEIRHSECGDEDLKFSLNDLDDSSRQELYDKTLTFQEFPVKLVELVSRDSVIINDIPLKQLVENKTVVVGEKVTEHFKKEFFIQRRFVVHKLKKNLSKGEGKRNKSKLAKSNLEFANELMNVQHKTDESIIESITVTLDKLLSIAHRKKIVVLSDNAGSGKTFALKEFSKLAKYKNPTHWVSFVDLKQHDAAFKSEFCVASDLSEDLFQNFFAQKIFQLDTHFSQKLFAQHYNEGKVKLFLDGFDEISPTYKVFVLSLIKKFDINLGNQLWITTRTHLKKDLENTVNHLSCSIEPLTTEDQTEFLVHCWMTKDPLPGKVAYRESAEEFVKKLFETLKENKFNAIGIALLVKMIADTYKDIKIAKDDFNIYSIFKNFITQIIKVWMDKGKVSKDDQLKINEQSFTILFIHYMIAMNYVLGFDLNYDIDVWKPEIISRLGIVILADDLVRFSHETFAEYLVADFITNNLRLKGENSIVSMKALIIVLCEEKHSIVRVFLENKFKDLKMTNDCFKVLSDNFRLTYKMFNCESILHHVLNEELSELSYLTLSVIRLQNEDNHKNMLTCISRSGINALHIAFAKSDRRTLETLLQTTKALLTNDELKALLKSRGNRAENILHCATQNEKAEDVFAILLKFPGDLLTEEEFKTLLQETDEDGNNVLHLSSRLSNENLFRNLLQLTKSIFKTDELKKLLQSRGEHEGNIVFWSMFNFKTDNFFSVFMKFSENILTQEEFKTLFKETDLVGHSVLHVASLFFKDELLENLLQVIKTIFDTGELKTLLQSRDQHKRDVLHNATENKKAEKVFSILWNFSQDFLSRQEFKALFMERDDDGDNVFHHVCRLGNEKVLDDLLRVVKSIFEIDELIALWQSRGKKEDNILHCATENNKSYEIFTILFEFSKNVFSKEELRVFMKETDGDANNFLHYAFTLCNEKNLDGILKLTKRICEASELKALLQARGLHERNVLHFATKNDKAENLFSTIWKFCENILTKEEFKILFKETDLDGNNVLHVASTFSNEKICENLLEVAKRVFDTEELTAYLQSRGQNEANFLYYAIANSERGKVFSILWEFSKKVLSKKILKKFIMETDVDGNNFLLRACILSNEIHLKSIFQLIKRICGTNELKALLKSRGQHERNILHYATANTKTERILSVLWKFFEGILTKREFKALFKGTDAVGANVLHLASSSSDDKILENCLEVSKNIFDTDELKAFLQSSTQYGNVLHWAIFSDNPEKMFSSLWKFSEQILTTAEFNLFLRETVVQGASFIHLVCGLSNEEILKNLLQVVKSIFDADELKALLHICDHSGRNILHCATTNYKTEKLFSDIWKFSEGVLTPEEFKTLFKQTDAAEANVLHLASRLSNEKILVNLLQVSKSILDGDELRILLQSCDQNKENIFHFATYNEKAVNVFSILWKFSGDFLTQDEFKTLFKEINSEGNNVLYRSCTIGNEKILSNLLEVIKSIFDADEVKIMLQARDCNGLNILHYATASDSAKDVFSFIWKISESFLSKEEFKALFKEPDIDGANVLQLASRLSSGNIFKDLLQTIESSFETDEFKALLQSRDEQGNVFHSATRNKNAVKVFSIFWKFSHGVLTKEELKTMLLEADVQGANVLHRACRLSNEKTLVNLLQNIKRIFEFDELKALFQTCGHPGNVFHCAAINEEAVFSILFIFSQNILTKEELKTLLKEVNADGSNVLHYVSQYSNKDNLEFFFQFVSRLFSDDELKILLFSCDKNQGNFLECATANQRVGQIFTLLWIFTKHVLTVEDFKTLVFQRNNEGNNVLHVLIRASNVKALKDLFILWKEIFPEEGEQKLLLMEKTNEKESNLERNSFELTVHMKKREVFETVKNFAKQIYSEEELKAHLGTHHSLGDSVREFFENYEFKK